MIADYLRVDGAAESFRESMAAATPRSLLLPSAIDDATAADLRARVDAAGWSAYALADRGRFHYCDTLRVDPLWDELAAVAADLAGARVALVRARWMRFFRGDYSLVKEDAATRPAGRHLELALDVSSGAGGEAEIVYAEGPHTFAVPQLSGLLCACDRTPAVTRYQRPPTVRSLIGGEITRLFLQYQMVLE
jgi:hypothetical protein